MADTIEEKWPRTLVGAVFFLFILIIAIATLLPNTMIDKAQSLEMSMAEKLLTQRDMSMVIDRTNNLYIKLVIDSGAKAAIADVFMPKGPTTVEAFEEKASWWFRYLLQRGEALQKITYQMFFRVIMMGYWVPFFLVVLIPAVFAGTLRWNAKRYGFDYSSPFINKNSLKILAMGAILLFLGIFLPAPLPPLVVSTILVSIVPSTVSLLISNLPKRI